MRFLDVFSGIGGFRAGLEKAGHECIGHIERDKYAVKSYTAIYDIKENEYVKGDITEIEDFRELKGKLDLLVGGFPCQSFSIAGNRKGFDDTRGTMFFYLAEILKQAEPPFFSV
jgi:DNA (cytosine-5)-methyltransferase 1